MNIPQETKHREAMAIVDDFWRAPHFFGDESEADYQRLRSDYLHELRPTSPYLCNLAEDLVRYEWEILRYRRLRDASVIAEYREYLVSVLEKGAPRSSFSYTNDVSKDNAQLVAAICSRSPPLRAGAEKEFEEVTGFSCRELLAMAFVRAEDVGAIEGRIANLELRRRRLREEYDRLRRFNVSATEEAEVAIEAG